MRSWSWKTAASKKNNKIVLMKNVLLALAAAALSMGLAQCTQDTGDQQTYALISTEYGDMKVKLYNTTPKHRDNFVKLAEEGFFDSLLFHRVIEHFMIQGGDPDSKNASPDQVLGAGGPGYTLPAEIGALHYKGALAAARLPDRGNPERNSSGSQFYIVDGQPVTEQNLQNIGKDYTPEQKQRYLEVGGAPILDGDYTVFGEVVEGMDVIDKIAAVPTGKANRPTRDIRMTVKIVD
mgnify:CR=1 FL=1